MSMMKELFIQAHEEIESECLEQGLSEDEAAKRAEDGAYDRAKDKFGDMIDATRDRMKHGH